VEHAGAVAGRRGHPDGAAAEAEGLGEVEHGGAQDGVRVVRERAAAAADVLRDGADDARGGLLAAPDGGDVAVELAGLVPEERLAGLEAEQVRDEAGRETAATEAARAASALAAVKAWRRRRESGRA